MEISVISGSGPEIENPHYRFLMLPMELSVLLSRLEAPQESLTLPNEIFFPCWPAVWTSNGDR